MDDTRHPSGKRWAINVLVIVGVFLLVHWCQTKPLASGEAPPLAGHLLSGAPFDLRELRGRPALVHFWATWCPVCKAEQDTIHSLAQEFPVISVAMQSGDDQSVREFMAREGLGFPTIPDPYGAIAGGWGVAAVPVSFVLDAKGVIRFSEVGFTTEAGLRARLWAARKM